MPNGGEGIRRYPCGNTSSDGAKLSQLSVPLLKIERQALRIPKDFIRSLSGRERAGRDRDENQARQLPAKVSCRRGQNRFLRLAWSVGRIRPRRSAYRRSRGRGFRRAPALSYAQLTDRAPIPAPPDMPPCHDKSARRSWCAHWREERFHCSTPGRSRIRAAMRCQF